MSQDSNRSFAQAWIELWGRSIQYHDENYTFWEQYKTHGHFDEQWLRHLLDTIQDWDLYLTFTIIDGKTEGRDVEKLAWFIYQVRQYRQTKVDGTWVWSA